jgi:mxaJ protein
MAVSRLIQIVVVLLTCACASVTYARELRVCADPNNMPFSNERQQGFENQLVNLVAKNLDAQVKYVWWAQRRGNIRNTLKAGLCDLVPGVASGLEMLATTQPYYRSTYVFVTRRDRNLKLSGFDDAQLHRLKIGVQMIGDDFANTPPAHALSKRGIVDNVRGYMLYGDYSQDSPPRLILEDVANGKLDLAVVWGPLAGYYAQKIRPKLALQPVGVANDGPELPMAFDISMGVRRQDRELKQEIEQVLAQHHREIEVLLQRYGVPTI